jgi:hypothetical protein
MGASLSALFEIQIDKVQQEKTSKMEKEIDFLRSAMNELKSDSTQLKKCCI